MSIPSSCTALSLPDGLINLLEGLTRAILQAQPADVVAFAAWHCQALLEQREGSSDSVAWGPELKDELLPQPPCQELEQDEKKEAKDEEEEEEEEAGQQAGRAAPTDPGWRADRLARRDAHYVGKRLLSTCHLRWEKPPGSQTLPEPPTLCWPPTRPPPWTAAIGRQALPRPPIAADPPPTAEAQEPPLCPPACAPRGLPPAGPPPPAAAPSPGTPAPINVLARGLAWPWHLLTSPR
ncbi:sperm surface protein Sp17 [Porphyrio hochstetteri]